MRINSEWIQYADQALHEVGIVIQHTVSKDEAKENKHVKEGEKRNAFPKEYKGYISAFAATIVQTGLYPALLIYENENAGAASKRYLLPYAVLHILNHKMPTLVDNDKVLSWQYHDAKPAEKKVLKCNIEKALVALKIAIRMYCPIKGMKLQGKDCSSFKKYQPQLMDLPKITEPKEERPKHPNIGWLYYRDYYRNYTLDKYVDDRKEKSIQEYICKEVKNKRFLQSTLDDRLSVNQKIKAELESNGYLVSSFLTTNPGLIIGLGLSHGTSMDNDYKCGFQFDHTSGLPYIPGSAVKGIIRSLFPSVEKEKHESAYNENRVGYINEVLGLQQPLTEDETIQLTGQLFDHSLYKDQSACIFMDAIITHGPHNGSNAPFMSNDFLTPHSTPYSEPAPIEFIKIVPNVEFTFFFKLCPARIKKGNGEVIEIPTDELFRLFKQILLDVGIGAKTDVGYGQLQEVRTE